MHVYRERLVNTGFANGELEPTRIYRAKDVKDFWRIEGLTLNSLAFRVDGKFVSAFRQAARIRTDISTGYAPPIPD